MWENIGKQLKTALLIILVAMLSLVMGVVGFSVPTLEGCQSDGPSYAAQVRRHTISLGEFRAAYAVTGFNRYPPERAEPLRLRELTLDGLIERALLVDEARRLGFTVDEEAVTRRIAREEIVLLAGPVDAPEGYPSGAIPQSFRGRDGELSPDNMRRFVQHFLRRSMEEFLRWQVEETLAEQVRDAVTANVSVSPREVRDAYAQETERARLSYVRFQRRHYEDRVEDDEASLTAWAERHQEDVDQEYRRQRHLYTGLEPQVRARHILIQVDENAEDSVREASRARAQALLERARAGEDFEALAREHSDDTASARNGGDLGFNERGRMVPPFDEAQFGLEVGQITENLVETRFGFHIIEAVARREGDVPEDEAKREVAQGLYRRSRAVELAREDAERALAFLRAGGDMEALDERLRRGFEPAAAPQDGAEDGDEDAPAPSFEGPDERGPNAPRVRQTSTFGRGERAVDGAFDSSPLTQAAFEMDLDSPLPDAPLLLGDDYFVFRLDERAEATDEGFTAEVRERIAARLLEEKRRDVLSAYIQGLKARAEADGAIRINPAVLRYSTGSDAEGLAGDDEA